MVIFKEHSLFKLLFIWLKMRRRITSALCSFIFISFIIFSTGSINAIISQPSLYIGSIKPIQVLEDVDADNDGLIDLVANKPIMVRVRPVAHLDWHPINISTKILLEVSDESGIVWSRVKSVAIKDYYTPVEIKNGEDTVNFFLTGDGGFKPVGSKNYYFNATIDPYDEIDEVDDTNNEAEVIAETREQDLLWSSNNEMQIIFRPIKIGKWKQKVDYASFTKTVSKSYTFFKTVYPVDPTMTKLVIRDEYTPEIDMPDSDYLRGIYFQSHLIPKLSDMAHSIAGKTGITTRIVGVVPKGSLGAEGLADAAWYQKILFSGANGVLIEEGTERAAAHEIAHTFGLRKEEEYDTNPTFGNVVQKDGWCLDPFTGQDCGARINLNKDRSQNDNANDLSDFFLRTNYGKRYYCMMGDALNYWIDTEDYESLMNKLTNRFF